MENKTGLTNRQKAMSIYKWTLRKYLPFSIAYWILLFLAFPMVEIVGMIICSQSDPSLSFHEAIRRYYLPDIVEIAQALPGTCFALVAILFSTIVTIMAFSYMHNKRAVDFFGSFPVSRRTLFFSRFAAVLTASIIPMLIFGSIGAFLTLSDAGMITAFKTMGIILLAIIGNVSFVAFISLCCGTVADVIISYGVINIVYPVCVVICYCFPRSIIPGISEGYLPYTAFTLFSPAAAPFVAVFGTGKILHIVWWIAMSAILISCCYALSKKRKAETAQNAFAFAVVEIVIKFVACFAAGFGAGWLFAYIGESVKSQYIWFVVGLVTGIMVVNLLLHLIFHRGLSRYKKSLAECGIVFAASMVFFAIVVTGAFGFDTRIPDADEIKEVSVQTGEVQTFTVNGKDVLEKYSSDETTISDTADLHEQIIELLKKSKRHGFYPITYNEYSAGIYGAFGRSYYDAVKIVYKLNNGKTMKRTFPISTEKLNISKELKNATVDDAQILQSIPTSYLESICWYKYNNGSESEVAYAYLSNDSEEWDKDKVEKVISALNTDIQEKGIVTESDYRYYFEFEYYNDATGESLWSYIGVPETYVNTIKALEETGYVNVGYGYLKNSYYGYAYESTEGLDLTEKRTVYFEVPDNWDKNSDVQCMPYQVDIDEEIDYKDFYRMTDIDDEITRCEKVSDKVWKYTIKVPKDDENDYSAVMFYQISETDTRVTGIVELSDKEDRNLLTIDKYPDVDDADFYVDESEIGYDYEWTAYGE